MLTFTTVRYQLVSDLAYFILHVPISKCLKNLDFSDKRSPQRARVFAAAGPPGLCSRRSIPTGLRILAQGFRTLRKARTTQKSTLKGCDEPQWLELSQTMLDKR